MEAVLDFEGGCQDLAIILLGGCGGGGGGSDKHSSPSAGHEAPRSPRLHSCWPRSVYQSGVSFLSFHLSLHREGCTVVDKNAHTMGARQLLYFLTLLLFPHSLSSNTPSLAYNPSLAYTPSLPTLLYCTSSQFFSSSHSFSSHTPCLPTLLLFLMFLLFITSLLPYILLFLTLLLVLHLLLFLTL